MKTIEKSGEALETTGNWGGQPKQPEEKYLQLTDDELKLETAKEEEQVSRMETWLNKKHDDVISMLKKRLHKKFRLSRLNGLRSI